MIKIIDQIGQNITISKPIRRIISLVPSQTELLIDLGLENFLVGVTKFCVHPEHIKKTVAVVGGTKNIKLEKIKSLNPDIIICNKEENTEEIVKLCNCITTTHVSNIYSLNDLKNLINQYGKIFACDIASRKIINRLNTKIETFKKFISGVPQKKVIYFIWRDPWMVAGNDNFINHLLDLNNFQNIFAHISRYPQINLKEISEQQESPDLILLSSEPYPFRNKHIFEIREHFKNVRVVFVDGEMFSWYGSRVLKAFDYFKELHSRI